MEYKITLSKRKIEYGKHESLIPCGLVHYFNHKKTQGATLKWTGKKLLMNNGRGNFIVFPRFETNYKDYLIHEVVTDVDKSNCMQLILSEHYLTAPNRGLFVACKAKNGELAGCYILDELTYGNPRARLNIDAKLARKNSWSTDNWSDLNRSEVRTALGMVWMSRIVVAPDFQNKGIGEAMASSALKLVKDYHPSKPSYVEIIASYVKSGDRQFSHESNIFCNAGYNHVWLNSSPHKLVDEDTQCYASTPGEKYYFWGKV